MRAQDGGIAPNRAVPGGKTGRTTGVPKPRRNVRTGRASVPAPPYKHAVRCAQLPREVPDLNCGRVRCRLVPGTERTPTTEVAPPRIPPPRYGATVGAQKIQLHKRHELCASDPAMAPNKNIIAPKKNLFKLYIGTPSRYALFREKIAHASSSTMPLAPQVVAGSRDPQQCFTLRTLHTRQRVYYI